MFVAGMDGLKICPLRFCLCKMKYDLNRVPLAQQSTIAKSGSNVNTDSRHQRGDGREQSVPYYDIIYSSARGKLL
jgi:hypothetical protein